VTRKIATPGTLSGSGIPAATRPMAGPAPTRQMSEPAGGTSSREAGATASLLPPRFEIRQALRGGGEADVYLCVDLERNHELVVVKRYRPFAQPDEAVLEKLGAMAHRHLVRVLDHQPWGNVVVEVDEYLEFGTLQGQRLDLDTLERAVRQLAGAVAYCHQQGILHRDIKPSNIYWKDRTRTDLALGDFGLTEVAFDVSRQDARRDWMSPLYSPPEAFASAVGDGDGRVIVSKPFDYYSLGMTLLVLLRGSEPTEDFADRSRLGELKMHDAVPLPSDLPDRWVTLLRGLMLADRKRRWGADELRRWLLGEAIALPELRGYRPAFRYRLSPKLEEAQTPEQLARQLIEHPDEALDDVEAAGGLAPVLIRQLCEYFAPIDQPRAAQLQGITQRASSPENAVLETALVIDPSLPFPLAPDLLAEAPAELARLIDSSGANWRMGREQLFSGRIAVWLRSTGRGALLDEWARERETYGRAALHDAGLERFLHILDPSLAPPSLKVSPRSIDWRLSVRDEAPATRLTITNPGRGYLSGNLGVNELPKWLAVEEPSTEFGVFAGAIASAAASESAAREAVFTVRASTSDLARHTRHVHTFTIQANRPGETSVRVRLIERVPVAIVAMWTALSAAVFGVVFAAARVALNGAGVAAGQVWIAQRYPNVDAFDKNPDYGFGVFAFVLVALLWAVLRLGRGPGPRKT
jgi:serine/threonine protein kinase